MTRPPKHVRKKSQADKRRKNRERALTSRDGIRLDMQQAPQAAWGTSPGSMGRVKAESEEAKLEACVECGYSGGRHSRMCPNGSGA